MERADWLLLYLGLPTDENVPPKALDPIRVMKGMFLFVRESGGDVAGLYSFEPYHYGPCSFELYGDLDELEAQGLIETQPSPGATWSLYRLTVAGVERFDSLLKTAPRALVERLRDVKAFVVARNFLQLLRDVYRKYPEFSVNSIVTFPH